MSTIVSPRGKPAIIYPASDGLPMSDNTKQFRWIVTIQGGLDALFRDVVDVFVAGNLLWYPVEGNNAIRTAPDIFVVFGRLKGDRSSYLQWEEGNIAPQVTFEVLSPGNRAGDLTNKFKFYETYGVEEYYLWDPDNLELSGWLRDGAVLRPIVTMNGWISPRLQVRFQVVDGDLQLHGPDNKKFATYVELVQQREELAKQREELARQHEQARQAKDEAQERAERLAAQLKALGIKPDA
jgi:Uma2 family endonuclease